MKRLILLLPIILFCLCSCGEKTQEEKVTLFPEESETLIVEEETVKVKVNDTYDKVLFEATQDGNAEKFSVIDDSVDYRTTASYRFEKMATDEAVRRLSEITERYSDVRINSVSVFDCMDDGEAVYYSFNIRYSYTVASGGRIDNLFYCDIGVNRADETVFDSSEKTYEVSKKYSIFKEITAKNGTAEIECDGKEKSVDEAIREFVMKRVKNDETARIFSVTETEDGMYEVVCSGENSYGLNIKDSVQVSAVYDKDSGILTLGY